MPDITPTPPREITIQKQIFEIPQPYNEGHVLTAVEAKQLNQTWSEGIRNNMATKVKQANEAAAAGDETAVKAVRKEVKDYAASYVFTEAGTARARLDPIQKEANRIARSLFVKKLADAGKKLSDLTATDAGKEAMKNKIAQIAEMPQVVKAASKRVKEALALAEADFSIDDAE